MNVDQMLGFIEELEKDAQTPQILSRIWKSGLGRAGAGAALGAGAGAIMSPEDRTRGALLGAGLGAGAGYGAILGTKAGRQQAKESLKRFFKSQYHGLTGRGEMPISPKASAKEIERLRSAEQAGITNVPGLLKGLAKDPKGTLKKSWGHTGTLGKAMAPLDLAMAAPNVLDPSTKEGYGEKTLGTLGSAGGYLLGSRLPFLGGTLLSSGTGYIGKKLGRGVDVLSNIKNRAAEAVPPGKLLPAR